MTPLSIISSPWFYAWLCGLCASWAALSLVFARVSYFKDKPKAAAHQVVVFVPFLFLAADGIWIWFLDPNFVATFKDDKVYGEYGPGSTWYLQYTPSINLVHVMLAFQIWDLLVTLLMAQEVKGQMQHIIHHVSSSILCILGLLNGPHGFLMYYAPFFFGVSEISSMPLAFMDLFKYSPELTKKFPKTSESVRVAFALLFLLVRCIYWPFVTMDFWIATINSSAPMWIRCVWWFFNIGLTALQYYWGSLIVKGIIKKLKGSKHDVESDQAGLAQIFQPGDAGSQLAKA